MSLVSPSRFVVLALSIAMLVSPFMSRTVAADIPPGGEYGGSVRVAILNTDAISINTNDTGASSQIVHQLVYDSLAKMSSDDYLPEPWLASSWTVNGNTITFQIRSGVKWSDATDLTVDDIVYNYVQAGYTASPGAGTVAITLPTGGGRFMGEGIYLPIAHKNLQPTALSYSGPYYANDTISPDHFTIAANPNHWRGRPYLDYVRYDYYSNMSLAACAFIDRKATFIGMAMKSEDLSTINWPCMKRIVESEQENRLQHLFYSQNPGLDVVYMGMNDAVSSPLNDPAVRLAIMKTIDRDAYAGSFGNPIIANSEMADSFISPYNTYWFNVSIPKYRVPRQIVGTTVTKIFDAINAELEAAGYMDWNFDGWRETPTHQAFTLRLLRLSSEMPALVDTLENDIRSIGLRLDDVPKDTMPEIMSEVQAGTFTLYLGTMQASLDPGFLGDYFYSSGVNNYFSYDSATVDGYLNDVENSLNTAMRQGAVMNALDWMANDIPAAPILHMKAQYVYDKLVYEGWVNQLGGINNFWSFYNLHAIPRGSMIVDVSMLKQGSRLNSGESTTVQVAVTNESGAIAGANVEIIVTNGVLGSAIGMTDSLGWYRTSYTAAVVDQVTDVFLTARVTKAGHTETWGQTAIAVYPGLGKMEVGIALMPNKRNLESNEEIELLIEVTDSLNSSYKIAGVNITITIVPDGIGEQLTEYQGFTNAVGRFTTRFKANVNTDVNFALRIKATYSGYEDKTTSLGIIVSKVGTPPPTPGPDVIVIVAVVAVLAFSYGMARRTRRKDSD